MSKYPYVALPSSIGTIYKPWVGVNLCYKKTQKTTPKVMALIDSGADVCFCSSNIGLWLGINLKKKDKFTFTTANRTSFVAVKETITIYACNKIFNCLFYFAENLPRETPIILGQIGFFDHFKIAFHLKNKSMEIV